MRQKSLGFVGLGAMGRPMATRLLDAGYGLAVYDTDRLASDALAALGAVPATSPADLAADCEIVLLSLPSPAAVGTVAAELAEGAAVRRVIDFSTIGPAAAHAASNTLAAKDMIYVDAPVSGGPPGARAGTLAIMVACGVAIFEEQKRLLDVLGKPFHLGETPGQAQTMKLANNLLAATAIAISSEAMAMGVRAGLDPKTMLEVINAGSGRNSATQDKFPRSILSGAFDYGFTTGLAYKDIRLCIDEAELLGVPMVVGGAVREMLAITNALYGPSSDYTSICRVVETWSGVQVRG